MKDEIVGKLIPVVSEPVDSECKVVYLLCEVRKLLEKYPPDPPPIALKLYCHWALHIDLTNPGTTGPLLDRVDAFVGRALVGGLDIIADLAMCRDFLFLDTFRQQLGIMLSSFDLPTTLCDEDQCWSVFIAQYARVIQDGSLSCESRVNPLKHVRKVVFNKGQRKRADGFVPFDIVWDIVLLDGRMLSVEVNTTPLPDGEPMPTSHLRLAAKQT